MSALKTYFKTVSPPYKNRDFLTLFASLFILIAIPVTVYVVINVREPASKAEVGGAVRGAQGDLWADIVIGKRDFGQIGSGYVNPQRVLRPGGAVVDRDTTGSAKGRLWVWDSNQNRLIGTDLDVCSVASGDCTATKVIGQPNLSDYSACNGDSSFQFYPALAAPSATSICAVSEEAVSTGESLSTVGLFSKGGNLYVPDMRNNRVLIYYDPWNTDSVADEVIGQDTFTTGGCNKSTAAPFTNNDYNSSIPSNSSLCFNDPWVQSPGAGVALDNSGNLWVADNGNNRVLRFPKTGTTISKTGDIVIGQTSPTAGPLSSGSALNQLSNPTSLRFDASGILYVADASNKRVLKYPTVEQKNGGTGVVFTTNNGTHVYVAEVDAANSGIWISSSSREHTAYDLALIGFDGVLKKSIFVAQGAAGSVGLGKDSSLIATSRSQGVMYFNNRMGPYQQCFGHDCWDKNIFVTGAVNQSRLNSAEGVAIAGNQMFVADHCRVLVWNDPASLTNGKSADHVLLQSNFTNFNCNAYQVYRIKADSDNRVYVGTDKGIYVFQAPVTTSTIPSLIPLNITTIEGQAVVVPLSAQGLAPQKIGSQLFLWVADVNKHRVLRIRDPLTNPKVDVVVGQANLSGVLCNRGSGSTGPSSPLNYLCYPGAVSIDKQSNVYISDFSLIGTETPLNNRLLMFSASKFPGNNPSTIFDQAADKNFSQWTFEPAFDSSNHMVVGVSGYLSRFFPYFLNPLSATTAPDGYFKDFVSWPYGATFDAQDNLYIADSIHSRVLIYKKPFGTATKPGDYDNNGSVGVGDLNILVNTWKSTTDLRADGNGSGVIDLGDLSILVNNWGS